MRKGLCSAGFALLFCFAAAARAEVPGLINFQGRLLDNNKLPRSGDYAMTFRICNSLAGDCSGACAVGNQCLWTENRTVTAANGVFSVQLGAVTPVDPAVFGGSDRYLEMVVAGETLSPRERLTSASFSFRSSVADKLPLTSEVADGTPEGQLAWDGTNDLLQVGTGGGIKTMGIPNDVTVYATAGSYTWTKPAGVSRVWVQVWGGGGGGGTGASNNSDGGGGGGGYSAGLVTVTGNVTVTVGAGGTSNGGAGGLSRFAGAATLTANGGTGTTGATGGAGGTASGGTINLSGLKGGDGRAADGAGSGNGGSSPFGGGGGQGQVGANTGEANTAGDPGQQPGGGGGGGRGTGAGGAGAAGMVIVMY